MTDTRCWKSLRPGYRRELAQRRESRAYRKGYCKGYEQALRDFAWWKDGKQYVGCGVKTLAQALEDAKL